MDDGSTECTINGPDWYKRESEWLSVGELALLLESARTFMCEAQAEASVLELPCLYELVATFMLTGATRDEITHLQICHLDFEFRTINIPDPETGRVDRSIPLHSCDIAAQMGISVRSVQRIAKEPPVAEPDDQRVRKARHVGRPALPDRVAQRMRELVAEDPQAPPLEVLRPIPFT